MPQHHKTGFRCPKCGKRSTVKIGSHNTHGKTGSWTRRTRVCPSGHTFKTTESVSK